MTDLHLLDDKEFWAWLCERHGWKADYEGWIQEHCPQVDEEEDNAYIYRASTTFSASEPVDRELYYNLVQFVAIACNPEILSSPNIAQQALEATQQAEKDLYAMGWSLTEIAEICRRETARTKSSAYQSWAMSKLSPTP
jgi:hypothetical protein